MKDINTITIIGRVAKDSELRYTSTGTAIASFAVAFTTSKKKGEQWEDQSNFIDLALFGKTAENLSKYLTKGTRVAVQGSLEQQRWEKDGQKQSKLAVHVDQIQLLGDKREGQAPSSGEPDAGSGTYEDDIPF